MALDPNLTPFGKKACFRIKPFIMIVTGDALTLSDLGPSSIEDLKSDFQAI